MAGLNVGPAFHRTSGMEGGACLGARHKLNSANFNGALIGATLLGLLLQSPLVFLIALAALVASAFVGGGIRPQGPRR